MGARSTLWSLAAFVGLALTAAQANGADMPVKARPVVAPVPSWTGFYLGLNAGGGWGDRNINYSSNDPASALLFSPTTGGQPPNAGLDVSGALAGGQIGYNWQFANKWVAGFEADFDWANVRGSVAGAAQITAGHPVIATVEERLNFLGTARARLGFLATDNLLLYGTGGFAYGQVQRFGNYVMTAGGGIGSVSGPATFVCFADGTPCFSGGNTYWAGGWTAGAGVEYAFGRWTIKVEYLHVSLDSQGFTQTALRPFPGNTPPNSSFNVNWGSYNLDVVRVGANLRF